MSSSQTGFAESIGKLAKDKKPFAIATVVKVDGHSLGKPGFKVVISGDGDVVYGTLGGVCPEGPIIAVAKEVMKTGVPRLVKVHLENVESSLSGMVRQPSPDEIYVETFCGGMMEIFVEPQMPPKRLVLIAQGGKDDVEEALIRMAKQLGFEVWALDPLPVLSTQPDTLISDLTYDFKSLNLGQNDYVVVLTKGARDVHVLEELSKTKPRFVGMLASKARVEHDFDMLRDRGVP